MKEFEGLPGQVKAVGGVRDGERSRNLIDGRLITWAPWFAWRPVNLEGGGFAWMRRVVRERWGRRCGDYYFEWNAYALLP